MFHPSAIVFKSGKETRQHDYANPEQAALVAEIVRLGIHGELRVPEASDECRACLDRLRNRFAEARERFKKVAASRTSTQSLHEKTTALLLHGYAHSRPRD